MPILKNNTEGESMRKGDRKKVALISLGLVCAGLFTACSGANSRDLENVELKDPQKVETYVNIDQHPNITRLCIDNIAWVTTAREYGDALTRVPEYDAWCRGEPVKSLPTPNSGNR